jgi:hypothetical protein
MNDPLKAGSNAAEHEPERNDAIEDLEVSGEESADIRGGLNPQPLPPIVDRGD